MRSINKTLADALRILAHDIESVDGVANAALQEAADRIDELSSEVEDLRNQNQEATDRIDELAAEVDDLRNQNHNNRVAAEARWDRIQRLEEAGDDIFLLAQKHAPEYWLYTQTAFNNWKQAKEAKP